MRHRARRPRRPRRRRLARRLALHPVFGNAWLRRAARLVGAALAAGLILALPFFVLVRSSLWFERVAGFTAWLAVVFSIVLTVGVLLGYVVWGARRFPGVRRLPGHLRQQRLPRFTRRGLALLVACYSTYAVVYLAAANAKDCEVRDSYRALHPSLRLAVATLILLDEDLVLSDVSRVPSDYARMGLPRRWKSAHYEQRDGWVHALDLRTRGRSRLRNWAVACYFEALGFEALRHGGSADHLHVSLPTANSPS